MNNSRPNDQFGAQFVEVAKLLEECPEVTRYDTADDREAWTLAHDFLDLEKSFNTLVHDLFPKLRNRQLTPLQRFELLIDIGEEFRHVLYHINGSKFYGYLQDRPDEATQHGTQ